MAQVVEDLVGVVAGADQEPTRKKGQCIYHPGLEARLGRMERLIKLALIGIGILLFSAGPGAVREWLGVGGPAPIQNVQASEATHE